MQFEGCYHGHSDGLLAKAGSGVASLTESASKGVPSSIVQETLVARLDNLDTLRAFFKRHPEEIAAVILEPLPANHGLFMPPRETLAAIVDLAHQHGALVIFDEVITGFRLGASGACGVGDWQPDIVTLGKIVGGGLPLAAVAAKARIMDHLAPVGGVYQAGTLSGNPLACAAGLAVLRELNENPPYAALAERTLRFTQRLREALTPKHAFVRSFASLFWIYFGPCEGFPPVLTTEAKERYAAFFRQALEKGVTYPLPPMKWDF